MKIYQENNLTVIEVKNAFAAAKFCLQGAHVMEFVPAGEDPVLWMSTESFFQVGKPIRGGIPICWPWFGASADHPDAPAHGVARISMWVLEDYARLLDGRDRLVFSLGYGQWSLKYTAIVGQSLELALETVNRSAEPQTFSEALHSYFAVSNIAKVNISGLEGDSFTDKLSNVKAVQQGPVVIKEETDRIYESTQTCVIFDAGLRREIIVEKSGSRSTVVWNPWVEKSRRMSDFGGLEYLHMLCVESANVTDAAKTLPPGESSELKLKISSRRQF